MVKNLPANAGNTSSIPGLGRPSGGGNSNLLQYSCLENPVDRRAWQATVHRISKSQIRLSMHVTYSNSSGKFSLSHDLEEDYTFVHNMMHTSSQLLPLWIYMIFIHNIGYSQFYLDVLDLGI